MAFGMRASFICRRFLAILAMADDAEENTMNESEKKCFVALFQRSKKVFLLALVYIYCCFCLLLVASIFRGKSFTICFFFFRSIVAEKVHVYCEINEKKRIEFARIFFIWFLRALEFASVFSFVLRKDVSRVCLMAVAVTFRKFVRWERLSHSLVTPFVSTF